jgi:hypothetical protein
MIQETTPWIVHAKEEPPPENEMKKQYYRM